MKTPSPTEIAKTVAEALRHDPESLDLILDNLGWTTFDEIVFGFERYSPFALDREAIVNALLDQNRGRFEIDGDRVRALSGHTTGQVEYRRADPPAELYRAEPEKDLEAISEHGIVSIRKKYVQLFASQEGAEADAKRRGVKRATRLVVFAQIASQNGVAFYEHDGHWYAEEVPPFYLEEG